MKLNATATESLVIDTVRRPKRREGPSRQLRSPPREALGSTPSARNPVFFAEDLLRFANAIRRSRARILSEFGTPLAFCDALLTGDPTLRVLEKASAHLAPVSSDLRDYQIASAYALLIGKERRKELSAYFTPPALSAAAIAAAASFLIGKTSPSILDPACGGGAFLVPLARSLAKQHVLRGLSKTEACLRTIKQLQGVEVDSGLAALSRRLLATMFKEEFGVAVGRETRAVIRHTDFLKARLDQKFDLIVGNPPYGRIRSRLSEDALKGAGLANNGGHTNFYSLFLMRALDWVKPAGGLVYILPTSFVAGPYFAGLRQEILDRADVVSIDLHEQRENLFVGAVQDVCILTLRRHKAKVGRTHHNYDVGIVDAAGLRRSVGSAETPTNGEPWMLPVATNTSISLPNRLAPSVPHHFTISDYGYRIRVGKVVPTRERQHLRATRTKQCLPLLWASCVRPDGSFRFEGGERSSNPLWYLPPSRPVGYATGRPCVVVQRTSNRDQHRRLNAAPVPSDFLAAHHDRGFVAENHVIVIEASEEIPAVTPDILAALLNSPAVNERFSAISGTFSVSARLLARLALPAPGEIPTRVTPSFAKSVAAAFASIDGVLAPSHRAGDPQNPIDKASDLSGRTAVKDNARFQRHRLA